MLDTVDKRYTPYIRLCVFLMQLKVVGVKKHSIGFLSLMRSGNAPVVQPHWIPLAVVSLSQDFIEFVPYKDRDFVP